MPINWLKLGMIMFASSLLSVGNAFINSNTPTWSEDALLKGEIRLADALSASDSILWVDARSSKDYEAGRIPRAILLNEDQWDGLLPAFLSAWQPGKRVVVYCSSQKCHASQEVAERLRAEVGMSDVYVLKGGWEAWLARNE